MGNTFQLCLDNCELYDHDDTPSFIVFADTTSNSVWISRSPSMINEFMGAYFSVDNVHIYRVYLFCGESRALSTFQDMQEEWNFHNIQVDSTA